MPTTVVLHGDPRATQQARLALTLASRGHHVVLCDAPEIAARVRALHPALCSEMSSHPRLPMRLPPSVTNSAWLNAPLSWFTGTSCASAGGQTARQAVG